MNEKNDFLFLKFRACLYVMSTRQKITLEINYSLININVNAESNSMIYFYFFLFISINHNKL